MIHESAWPRARPLRLERVTVRRGSAVILDALDLVFEPGRRYVLFGASGAGKSTLLRLLNRLDDPDAGRVLLGEIPLASLLRRAWSAPRSGLFSRPLARCQAACSITWFNPS